MSDVPVTLNIVLRPPRWLYPAILALGWVVRLGFVSEARAIDWAAWIGTKAAGRMLR